MAFRAPNLEGDVSSARDVSSSAGPGDPTMARGGGFSLRQVLSAGSKAKPSRRNSPVVGRGARGAVMSTCMPPKPSRRNSRVEPMPSAVGSSQGSSGFVRVRQGSSGFARVRQGSSRVEPVPSAVGSSRAPLMSSTRWVRPLHPIAGNTRPGPGMAGNSRHELAPVGRGVRAPS